MTTPERQRSRAPRKPRRATPQELQPVLTHRPPNPNPFDRTEEGRRPPPSPRGESHRDPPDADDLH